MAYAHLLRAPCPGNRLAFVRLSLGSDTDDVRVLAQGVATAMKTVARIGATRPLLLLHQIPLASHFLRSSEAVALSALASLYQVPSYTSHIFLLLLCFSRPLASAPSSA